MNKSFLKDALGWGFLLWFIGYVLGIILFFFVPHTLIGWILLLIGTLITLFVLLKRVQLSSFSYAILLSLVWTVIAIGCDYFFLVKLFKPVDGYYKLDVYLYYLLTFLLPVSTYVLHSRRWNRHARTQDPSDVSS